MYQVHWKYQLPKLTWYYRSKANLLCYFLAASIFNRYNYFSAEGCIWRVMNLDLSKLGYLRKLMATHVTSVGTFFYILHISLGCCVPFKSIDITVPTVQYTVVIGDCKYHVFLNSSVNFAEADRELQKFSWWQVAHYSTLTFHIVAD